jgi:hypothetical protein
MVLHAHILPGQWTIGPLVAAVQRRKLTPSTWSWSSSSIHSFIHLLVFNDAVSCLDYIIASNDRVIVAYWIRRDMKGNSRLAFPLGTGKNHKEPRVRMRWRNAKDSVETFCEDYSLLECIALMMEAVRSSETSVYFNYITWRYIPEDCNLHTRCRENLKSHRDVQSFLISWSMK